MVKDYNGNQISVGDIVMVHSSTTTQHTELKLREPGFCGMIHGIHYRVTELEPSEKYSNRISIIHESTGLTNGWVAEYFVKVYNNVTHKGHYPDWF